MKRLYIISVLFISFLSVSAQTNSYTFNGNFNENNGSGPALSEALACSAANGNFATSIINTSTGNCGNDAKPVFNFNAGGGLNYPNGQITGTYTLHMFFSFAAVNGYRRVVDFLNGQSDVGLYILDGSLNFYPNGNVGTANAFTTNTFYLLSLVRDGASSQIQIYLNGNSFGAYSDAAGNYATATTGIPIFLFRDNISGNAQCENSAGKIKYFSISPAVSTPAEVAATYAAICSIALPLKLLHFSVSGDGSTNTLSWQTASEVNVHEFAVERSNDGKAWEQLGKLQAGGKGLYVYADQSPLTGTNYYRLRINDLDGAVSYSQVIAKTGRETKGTVNVTPVPALYSIKVSIGDPSLNGKPATICDMQGREMYRFISQTSQVIDISSWPAGIYSLLLPGAKAVRIVKQ